MAASLNETLEGINPLINLTELDIDRLEVCSESNISPFAIELAKFGKIFLVDIFRKLSWNQVKIKK